MRFSNDNDNAQGRFNMFKFRVPRSLRTMATTPMPCWRWCRRCRRSQQADGPSLSAVPAIGADQDIRQQTEILGDAFDEVVLFEDQCQRGRQDGEVITLLRQGLADAKKTTSTSEIRGEFLAIDTAMDKLDCR